MQLARERVNTKQVILIIYSCHTCHIRCDLHRECTCSENDSPNSPLPHVVHLTLMATWLPYLYPSSATCLCFKSFLQLVCIRVGALQPEVRPDIVRPGARWRNLNVLSGRKLSVLQAHSSALGWLRSLNFLMFDKAFLF